MTTAATVSKRAGNPQPAEGCRPPLVLVGIRHQAMRRLTSELLERERSWTVAEVGADEMLVDAIARNRPEAIVIDAGDFPACCHAALARYPRNRVIVVGPEPDERYRTIVLAEGAASWVARERIGEELVTQLRTLMNDHFE